MMGQQKGVQWYAVQVRSRHEDVVARHLRVRGMEAFLPQYRQRHRWSDRFEEVDLPLFPGYVFCEFSPLNRLPVLTVPGVVQIVGAGKNLLPIDESEIAAIQAAAKSGLPTRPSSFLEIGEKVRIEYGPLCGIEGILLGFRSHQRLVLSISLLQRSIAVQIDSDWVRPLSLKRQPSGRPVIHQDLSRQPAL
jgi:transcription antitermination factor NusG